MIENVVQGVAFVYVAIFVVLVALACVGLVFGLIKEPRFRREFAVLVLIFLAALGTRALW